MVFNQFAAGRKVYGQGSYAPNRGKVNPRGYVQRELRKKQIMNKNKGVSTFGQDGKSDTRSGAAKAILARRAKAKAGPVKKKPVKKPTAMKPMGVTPKPATPSTPPAAEGPNQTGQLPADNFQPIQISPNGTLDLPYDMQSSTDLLAQKEQANAELQSLQAEEQAHNLEFGQAKRDADIDYQDLARSTLANAAGRGVAFSSGYGVQVGRNATDFNNYMSDLIAGDSAFKQDAERRRGGVVTAFNDFLRKDALDRAARAAANAGNLGYGKTPVKTNPEPKVPTNKPKPKPKPKAPPKKKGGGNSIPKTGPKKPTPKKKSGKAGIAKKLLKKPGAPKKIGMK